MRKIIQAGIAAVAVASLGACAPGVSFGVASPGCGYRAPWTTHSRMNVNSVTQRVQRVQARYSAGYSYTRRNPENWRAAATGECR